MVCNNGDGDRSGSSIGNGSMGHALRQKTECRKRERRVWRRVVVVVVVRVVKAGIKSRGSRGAHLGVIRSIDDKSRHKNRPFECRRQSSFRAARRDEYLSTKVRILASMDLGGREEDRASDFW